MKVFLVIGLCGSGKTFWANQNADVVVDDITNLESLPSPEVLINKTLALTSPLFCDSEVIEKAEKVLFDIYGDVDIEKIYFENDVEKCLRNVEYRGDSKTKKVKWFIKDYSKIYNPPENALKIWNP